MFATSPHGAPGALISARERKGERPPDGELASADLEPRCCGSAGPDGIGAEGDPITVTCAQQKSFVRAGSYCVYGEEQEEGKKETNQKAVRVQADCVQRR